MQEPGFWDEPSKSTPVLQKRRGVERRLESLTMIRDSADELETWAELLSEGEVDDEVIEFVERLEKELHALDLRMKLGGEHDEKNCLCMVHSGAGGT